MLRVGEESPVSGFVVVEAIPGEDGNPGRYEVSYRIDAATTVNFTHSTEDGVLAAAASWLSDQLRRKDRGALGKPSAPKTKTKRKPKNVVEA